MLRAAFIVVALVLPFSAQAGYHHPLKQIVRRDVLRVASALDDLRGKAIGYAEMAGLHISVHHPYQERVTKALWRGSRVNDAGLADLKKRGFVAVVGLTRERDLDKDAEKIGLPHKLIPIIDNHTPTMAQVHEFLDYVKAQKGPVYVHCEAGVGRTGIMVAAYRIAVQGWDVGHALVDARKHGLHHRNQVEFIRTLGSLRSQ